MRRSLALTLVALALVAPSVAADEPKPAAQLFRAGREAFDRGYFRTSAEAFAAAFRADPRAASIYNAGIAWQAAGERGRAVDALLDAMRAPDLSPAQRSDAEARLRVLTPSVALVRVAGPAGADVLIDDRVLGKAPVEAHVDPGDHATTIRGRDGVVARTFSARAGETIDLEESRPPPPAASFSPPSARSTSDNGGKTVGTALVGGAAVLTGVGAALGLSALSARDAFDASGHTDRAAHDRAASRRLWADVAFGAAIVAGAAGLVVLLGSSENVPAAFVDPHGVGLRGRF